VKIQNLDIRPVNPVPMVETDYEIIFSADAEFTVTDKL